jgi:hypothetical protein
VEIPPGFTEHFLNWFRARTEATWSTYRPRTFEDYVAAGVGGSDWQRGTRWAGGLSEEQIEQIERRWSLRFPPDYRLFLRVLHTIDRPTLGAFYNDDSPSHLVPRKRPSFYNWLVDEEVLLGRFDWLVEGLQFDVEHNRLWLPGWGVKPSTLSVQKERVRALVAAAPHMIPVFGHRYLLAEPCQSGNPIFSIYQSDIIVYGPDLRTYFLREFLELLGINEDPWVSEAYTQRAREEAYEAIPFWGEIYRDNK